MRAVTRRAVLSTALAVAASPAFADDWPNKPIKLINGYPPGGGADILARLVAERLSGVLGQQVIVDNRTGATGVIAAQSVAASAPDGYTLLEYTMNMGASSVVMPGTKLGYDPDKDLLPIVNIAGLDNLLYINPKLPFRTVKDVIDYAKANPGKLTMPPPASAAPITCGARNSSTWRASTCCMCRSAAARRRSPRSWRDAST